MNALRLMTYLVQKEFKLLLLIFSLLRFPFYFLYKFSKNFQPLDNKTLIEQAKRIGGKVLTVEDHYQTGGIGEAVALALADIPEVHVRSLCIRGFCLAFFLLNLIKRLLLEPVKL